jgi:hypothetical protein
MSREGGAAPQQMPAVIENFSKNVDIQALIM